MNNLTRYEQDGLELIVDTVSGEVFVSQRALARMCNKNEKTIRRFVTAAKIETKKLKIPTNTGFKTAALLNEDSLYLVLEKYNPNLLIQCAKAGLRIYLHGLAGFRYQVKKQLTREEIIEMCCLPVPAKWQRRFPEQFYSELCRLTGLQQQGNKRPA